MLQGRRRWLPSLLQPIIRFLPAFIYVHLLPGLHSNINDMDSDNHNTITHRYSSRYRNVPTNTGLAEREGLRRMRGVRRREDERWRGKRGAYLTTWCPLPQGLGQLPDSPVPNGAIQRAWENPCLAWCVLHPLGLRVWVESGTLNPTIGVPTCQYAVSGIEN